MDLFDVVRNAVEQPLRVHLSFPSESEPVQFHYGSYMGKGRFGCPKSSVIDKSESNFCFILWSPCHNHIKYHNAMPDSATGWENSYISKTIPSMAPICPVDPVPSIFVA